jgi:four helix bundle protein
MDWLHRGGANQPSFAMRQSYQRLAVWEKAMELLAETYALAGRLPAHERFELSVQLRSAAVSVVSNIAEGHGRFHAGDFVRSLSIASGSLRELETQLHVAVRVGYLTPEAARKSLECADEVGRMLAGLIKAVRRNHKLSNSPTL